jgi:hypothetical protein
MTPQQEAEYLQDLKSFRAEFIANLTRELIQVLGKEVESLAKYCAQYPSTANIVSEKLNEKLPSACECTYPVD